MSYCPYCHKRVKRDDEFLYSDAQKVHTKCLITHAKNTERNRKQEREKKEQRPLWTWMD